MTHNACMRFGSLFGWGIVIYAVVSLAWSGLVLHGLTAGIAPRIIECMVLLIVCLIAGNALKFRSWKDILPYSIGWAIVAALLDIIYGVPFSGWSLYSEWSVWAGYALVVVLPLFAPLTRVHAEPSGAWES
jgi:hypothetical protein